MNFDEFIQRDYDDGGRAIGNQTLDQGQAARNRHRCPESFNPEIVIATRGPAKTVDTLYLTLYWIYLKQKITIMLFLSGGYASRSRYTVCPRSSYPFYTVSSYVKWVTTSWTNSIKNDIKNQTRLFLDRQY